jgi:hypothetical protein
LRNFIEFCGTSAIDVNPFGEVASLVFLAFLRKKYAERAVVVRVVAVRSQACGSFPQRGVTSRRWNATRPDSDATTALLSRRNARFGPLAVCEDRSDDSWRVAIRSVVNRHIVVVIERDEILDPTPFREVERRGDSVRYETLLLYGCISVESSGFSRLQWLALGARANFLGRPTSGALVRVCAVRRTRYH